MIIEKILNKPKRVHLIAEDGCILSLIPGDWKRLLARKGFLSLPFSVTLDKNVQGHVLITEAENM